MTTSVPNQPTINESPQGLQITWQGNRDSFNAIRSSFIILVYIAFATWVIHLLQDMWLRGRELTLASWIVLGVTILYLVFSAAWRVIHVIESFMDRETITIDEKSVLIVRNGPGKLRQQAIIPAEQVKYIQQTMAGFNRVLYLELTPIGSLHNRFRPIALPAFCRGISEAEATVVLIRIHERFPQFRVIKA